MESIDAQITRLIKLQARINGINSQITGNLNSIDSTQSDISAAELEKKTLCEKKSLAAKNLSQARDLSQAKLAVEQSERNLAQSKVRLQEALNNIKKAEATLSSYSDELFASADRKIAGLKTDATSLQEIRDSLIGELSHTRQEADNLQKELKSNGYEINIDFSKQNPKTTVL